jgi:hypothetical protein
VNSRLAYRFSQAAGFVAAAKVAQIFKVSFVLGSYTMFFSMSNCITPLAGAFAGFGGASFALILKTIYAVLVSGGMVSAIRLIDGIPGFFAGYYWVSNGFFIRVVVPISCMVAFILHPIGSQAWGYTLFWWLPVVFYIVSANSLFTQALGSTLTAHAVGSAFWIYCNPMTPDMWLALIPVVVVERLFFASGMVVLYKLGHWLSHTVSLPVLSRVYKTA